MDFSNITKSYTKVSMIKDIIDNYKTLIKRINSINKYLTEEERTRNTHNPFIYSIPKTYVWIDKENN